MIYVYHILYITKSLSIYTCRRMGLSPHLPIPIPPKVQHDKLSVMIGPLYLKPWTCLMWRGGVGGSNRYPLSKKAPTQRYPIAPALRQTSHHTTRWGYNVWETFCILLKRSHNICLTSQCFKWPVWKSRLVILSLCLYMSVSMLWSNKLVQKWSIATSIVIEPNHPTTELVPVCVCRGLHNYCFTLISYLRLQLTHSSLNHILMHYDYNSNDHGDNIIIHLHNYSMYMGYN